MILVLMFSLSACGRASQGNTEPSAEPTANNTSSGNENYREHVDSFNLFEPDDVDEDGISEIVCRQYTCLNSHADYAGSAMTVLKYNSDTQEFYVYDAWFEPAEN